VRLKCLPSLLPFAGLFHRVRQTLSWGEHRGGMFILVKGEGANGVSVERSWHMIADGDDGPFIPAMAAAAIIKRCRAGMPPRPGARAATGDLELSDYEALFARRNIVTGVRTSSRPGRCVPLYRRILGSAYERVPGAVQVLHDLDRELSATGTASVERGSGVRSRLAAWIVGFPPAGDNVPVTVSFRVREGREYWRRNFGGHEFESLQEEGMGRNEGLLCEGFGPLRFALALVVEGDRLRLVMRRWTLFGIPLPMVLAPRIDAYEFVEDGRFCFHVEIRQPLVGLVVRYRGCLPEVAS
jgi:hypothetical protein